MNLPRRAELGRHPLPLQAVSFGTGRDGGDGMCQFWKFHPELSTVTRFPQPSRRGPDLYMGTFIRSDVCLRLRLA
jgi:hypothetical protein